MKSAITAGVPDSLLKTLDRESLRGQRDRAILLVGFAGAFRRSELAALDVADLLRRARSRRHGRSLENGPGGRRPPRRYTIRSQVRRTLSLDGAAGMAGVAEIGEGAVFRTFALPRGRRDQLERLQATRISGRDVARIVQRAIASADVEGDFSGHSLRAGFVTSAAQKKVPEVDIMRVTGHRSTAVLRGYVRRATLFDDAPLTTILE